MPKPRKSPFEQGYILVIDRLVARRRELGLNQAEVGVRYGEDQSFVSRVERRQRRIDVWEYVRFCRVLEIDPGAMLNETLAMAPGDGV